LVVMPRNLGYAAANNAGAAVARGAALLLLNSDVVPARPGWLTAMRGALAGKGVGAVGPKLLFDDGSLQHAGLLFRRDEAGIWFNAHYHKGLPRGWAPANRRRAVPGVTGAALMVRRALFEALGGISEDYIIGDYEDSDFCLRLRATGASIVYVPEAELFHFERRSIHLHSGYTRTLASLYNRRLHHRRWDGAMATLMARRGFRGAA
jgi:GT2 family glycosyltransferase